MKRSKLLSGILIFAMAACATPAAASLNMMVLAPADAGGAASHSGAPLPPLWAMIENVKGNCRFVDLSHELSPQTPHWSGFPAMSVSKKFDYPDGFLVHEFQIVSQYGTHADVPSHFIEGGRPMHEIAPEELLLPLCVVDITAKVAENVDYAVSVQDLLDWEEQYGRIPPKAFVAIRSDWSKRDDLDNRDANGAKHYPGWSLDALKFLVEQRDVGSIGHETSDTDTAVGAARDGYICEYYILEQNRYQIELLKNLSELPPIGSLIFCGFPKVKDGPGFTARCIAICPK